MSSLTFENLLISLYDPLTLIVYAVFISQIAVISFYIPAKWRRFRKELFEEHPQYEYPKLYYQPFEIEIKRQQIRKVLDISIALIGVSTFVYCLTQLYLPEKITSSMFYLAILQLFPFVISQHWGRKNIKLMQKMPQPQKRVSFLAARKLSDFVPPIMLSVAILAYIASMILGLVVYWDTINSESILDIKSWSLFGLLALNTSVAIYVALLINKTLYAKREDQNLNKDDRLFFIQKKIKKLVYSIILYSLFIFALIMFKMIGFGITGIFILTSIYMQVFILIEVNPTKERDFDVYKADVIDNNS